MSLPAGRRVARARAEAAHPCRTRWGHHLVERAAVAAVCTRPLLPGSLGRKSGLSPIGGSAIGGSILAMRPARENRRGKGALWSVSLRLSLAGGYPPGKIPSIKVSLPPGGGSGAYGDRAVNTASTVRHKLDICCRVWRAAAKRSVRRVLVKGRPAWYPGLAPGLCAAPVRTRGQRERPPRVVTASVGLLVELRGFEPLTSTLPVLRSPD